MAKQQVLYPAFSQMVMNAVTHGSKQLALSGGDINPIGCLPMVGGDDSGVLRVPDIKGIGAGTNSKRNVGGYMSWSRLEHGDFSFWVGS